jgi:D-alanine-D-alanine ligase
MFRPPYIIKPVWEHASYGMDDTAVVFPDDISALERKIVERAERLECPCFAEQYIEGRELNVSLLVNAADDPAGDASADVRLPQVLPPAEIDFSTFSAEEPRIVGYRAKWDTSSREYHLTPRRFEFPDHDWSLLDTVKKLAQRCWNVFGLRGYARVDLRVDRSGRPWILEINANPCLADDAGFAAAIHRAGIPYDDAIDRIVRDALRPIPWAPTPALG